MADPAEDVLAVYIWYRIGRAFVTFWWRFLTGAPLDGKPRTRSSFLHGSDESVTVTRRASTWAKKPGYARAGWRLYWMVMLGATLWGWIFWWHPPIEIAWLLIGALWLGHAATRADKWARKHALRHNIIDPLAAAVGHAVGQANAIRPSKWVHFDPVGKKATIDLPEDFMPTPELEERVATIAAEKLGGREWEATYDTTGSPTLVLEHAPPPRDTLPWRDALPYIVAAAGEGSPFIGLGSRDRVATLPLRGETPHVYCSIPNGLGKTTFGRTIGCQVLHDGGRLLVIDSVKKISHDWAYNLPGVTYCRTAEEAHWTLLRVQDEIAARYEAPDPEKLPQLLLIVEDALGTADQLQVIWRTQLGKGSGLVRSPAVMALQEVFTAGRQCNASVALFAQKAVATAFGGSNGAAARENALPILHSMCSAATWELLADIHDPPPQEPRPGRVWLINAGLAQPVQVANPTAKEARAWATSGVPQPPAPPEVDELPGWLSESPSAVA